MSSQNRIGVILVAVVVASVAALVFNRDTTASAEGSVGDISVSCGSTQRAVVQRSGSGPGAQINVQCVEADGMQASSNVMLAAAPLTPVASGLVPAAPMPAVIYQPAPQAVQGAVSPVRSTPVRRAERKPSVQKRLLIIGGTSGVGAGIGALVGGKKGALIGAAIGGGGAAIVDQVKHR